jgi:hypothetical protein
MAEQHHLSRRQRNDQVEWDTTTPPERAILENVQHALQQDTSPSTNKTGQTWQWTWATIPAALAIAAIAWFQMPPSTTAPSTRRHITPPKPRLAQLTVPKGQTKQIGTPRHWKATASSGTHLQWLQNDRKRVALKLHTGQLKFNVTPGTMKSLTVAWKGKTRVEVKGTLFTVQQHKDWLRVEVQRGKVAITHPTRPTFFLTKGQGARLPLSGKPTQYKAPTTVLSGIQKRFKWFRTHSPKAMCQVILDWRHTPGPTPKQKNTQMEAFAYQLIDPAPLCSFRLWESLYSLHMTPESTQTALEGAANLCGSRKLPTSTAKRCVQLYKTYLTRYPKGSIREHVKRWLTSSTASKP